MTDNEIIKALECCIAKENCEEISCEKCPLERCADCKEVLFQSTLDLINRQKAEIERLQSMNQSKLDIIHDVRAELETAKSEAIKELAERLKEKAVQKYDWNEYVEVDEIDNLVKEMVGD